jgi:hypothetical protein
VITANRVPDQATIARFVCRHEAAPAELFGSVLALCARAGLVSTGVVAIDGTKLHANASREANSDYERIARDIVAEAKATDEAEDVLYGHARGDELSEELRTSAGRRMWLREAKRALDQESTADPLPPADKPPSMPRGMFGTPLRRDGWSASYSRGRRRPFLWPVYATTPLHPEASWLEIPSQTRPPGARAVRAPALSGGDPGCLPAPRGRRRGGAPRGSTRARCGVGRGGSVPSGPEPSTRPRRPDAANPAASRPVAVVARADRWR